jgi:hypothetical protein
MRISKYKILPTAMILFIAILASCKQNSSNELLISLHTQADSLFVDNQKAKDEWCNCVMNKLKNANKNISADSAETEKYIIGSYCANNIKGSRLKGWSHESEEIFKSKLLQSRVVKGLQEQHKIPFCNCYLEKLKHLYPTGLSGIIPDNVQNSISISCAQKIGIR